MKGSKAMNNEFVVCKICSKKLKRLNRHLSTHNLTVTKYKEMYPETETITNKVSNKMSESAKRRFKEIQPSPLFNRSHKTPWNKGLHGKEHLKHYEKGEVWNKGLTKETDERVRRYAENLVGRKPPFKKGLSYEERYGKERGIEIKTKIYRKLCYTRNLRPTTLEKKFINLIEIYMLPINYVGNGKLIIGGKCPDFAHETKQILYEVAEPFYKIKVAGYKSLQHYLEVRQEHFGKYGYKVYLITPNDLDDKRGLLKKIGEWLLV